MGVKYQVLGVRCCNRLGLVLQLRPPIPKTQHPRLSKTQHPNLKPFPLIYSPAVSRAERGKKPSAKKKPNGRFPLIVFLLLLATIYLFWIYPLQRGRPPVQVSFEPAPSNTK